MGPHFVTLRNREHRELYSSGRFKKTKAGQFQWAGHAVGSKETRNLWVQRNLVGELFRKGHSDYITGNNQCSPCQPFCKVATWNNLNGVQILGSMSRDLVQYAYAFTLQQTIIGCSKFNFLRYVRLWFILKVWVFVYINAGIMFILLLTIISVVFIFF
jgi:hypothetical protein